MKLSHEVYKYCGLNQITGHVTDLVQMIFLGQFSTMWYELGFPLATDRRTFKCISAVHCTFYLFFVRIKLLRRFKFRDFLWVFLPLISNISMSIFSANSDKENHPCSHLTPQSILPIPLPTSLSVFNFTASAPQTLPSLLSREEYCHSAVQANLCIPVILFSFLLNFLSF